MAKEFEFTIPDQHNRLPLIYLVAARTITSARTQLRAELDQDDPELLSSIDIEALPYVIVE